MAEKRVSVRLVAEGGRQVRAELEGVGTAGAKGIGRLSREMELANTRLAPFCAPGWHRHVCRRRCCHRLARIDRPLVDCH